MELTLKCNSNKFFVVEIEKKVLPISIFIIYRIRVRDTISNSTWIPTLDNFPTYDNHLKGFSTLEDAKKAAEYLASRWF